MPEETQEKPQDQTAETEQDAEQAEVKTEEAEGDDAAPEYDVRVEDAGTLKKKIAVTVPRERIDAKMDEMYGELSNTAQVPGFRVGRAPRRLIEKRFGREVGRDVRNALIGEALGGAVKKSGLNVLGEPDIDLETIELPDQGDMEFSFEVEIEPEFELPELKGVEVRKLVMRIDDKRVDEMLDQWRSRNARYEDTGGAAAEGDTVTADATVTGEGIEPARTPGLSLRVAPGQIEGLPLVDLGKALTGKKADQTAELTVTVPQAHPNEAWRGKEVTVAVHISQVRRRVLPKIDGDFAASYGFESVQLMRQAIRRNLEARVDNEVRQHMRDQVCDYLLDKTQLDVPAGVAQRQTTRVLRRRYVNLLQKGVPRERIDENLTQLQAGASEQAARELKLSFVLGKICQERNIEVADEEVNSAIAEMARAYNRRPERLRQELTQDGSLEQVAITLREQKAMDQLLSDAKVTEVDSEAEAKEKQPPEEKPAKKSAKKTVKKPAKKAAKKTAKKAERKPAGAAKKKAAKKPVGKSPGKTDKKDAGGKKASKS